MKTSKIVLMALFVLMAWSSVLSQAQTPRVDARERRQQKRIEQGVKSGELTPAETRRLEAREGKIKADEMQAKSDGKVTKFERRKLNREQNRESRAIYRKKHNNREQK